MEKEKLNKKEHIALREYNFAEKLRESYFRTSWVAASIILPVCFSLIGLSYAEWLVNLRWFQLLPLAFASIFLGIFWYLHIFRYANYMKIIYGRLQELETMFGMNLHTKIKREARGGWRSLKFINFLTLVLLIAAWVARLYLAYLIVGI